MCVYSLKAHEGRILPCLFQVLVAPGASWLVTSSPQPLPPSFHGVLLCVCVSSVSYIIIQSLSRVRLFTTPWTTARQAPLSFTISQGLLKLMCIESVMPSNHLILCHSLLLPSIFPGIRVFSKESVLRIKWPEYWSFSFSIRPSSEYSLG